MKKIKVLVISGPNLNMLEFRNKSIYGGFSLAFLEEELTKKYENVNFEFFQSNHEGLIIDKLQKTNTFDAILINAAAYTHTSIAIRDTLELLSITKVEVHLSDFTKREDFRKVSLLTEVCDQTFYGKQINSYFEALDFICKLHI